MGLDIYNPVSVLEKTVSFAWDISTMVNIDNALQVLPSDTTFALVVEAVERNMGESFTQATWAPGLGASIGNTTAISGRFVGYLAVTPTMLIIYSNGQIVFQDSLPNIVVEAAAGTIAIHNSTKQYLLTNAYPINHADGHFSSKVFGANYGLNALIAQITAGGGQNLAKSGKGSIIVIIIIIVAMLAFFVAMAVLKRASSTVH